MKGRSKAYVDAVCAALPDVRVSTHVSSVKRVPGGVTITTNNGTVTEEYEDVILACHSDQALSLLGSGGVPLVVPSPSSAHGFAIHHRPMHSLTIRWSISNERALDWDSV